MAEIGDGVGRMNRTVTAVLLLAASAMAGDLTGKWSGTFKLMAVTTVSLSCSS
jgi:hypothetical protein